MKIIIAYITWALAVTLLFLYILFPEDMVLDFADSMLTQKLPGYHLNAGRVKPAFPLGISMSDVTLERNGDVWYALEKARVKISIPSLIDEPEAKIECLAYDGNINGNVRLTRQKNQSGFDINLAMVNLDISQCLGLQLLAQKSLAGTVEGSLHFSGHPDRLLQTKGEGQVKISQAEMDMMVSILPIDTLSFDSITADFSMDKGVVRLKECTMNGQDVTGSLSGTMLLKRPVKQSTLTLSGNAKPAAALLRDILNEMPSLGGFERTAKGKGFPFTISGTIDETNFSLR